MGAPPATTGRATERMLRFERALVRVRWFGIALGAYQVGAYQPLPDVRVPGSMYVISWTALGLLALLNIVVPALLRRERDEGALRRLGAGVFAADLVALWAIVWAFTFEQFGATWVLLLIACLEGAVRFQFRGALTPVALALGIEPLREIYGHLAYDHVVYVTSVTYRIGMMAIIAFISGAMSRNLEREREAAESRALELADLAEREATARAESAAFQEVILAGVVADSVEAALESMLAHVATDLGYTNITVLMIEGDRLRPVALAGFSSETRTATIAIGEGIVGVVAQTGTTEIVPDVSKDPRYFCVQESTSSQISLPIATGDKVLGVLHCESPELDAFDQVDAARLGRLCAQMALVIENARLLAQERQAVERLQDLDLMKSDFVAIASHELRTPLTAMQGSIKTLRRPGLSLSDETVAEMLAILDRQSDRLTRLVEDLLIVSRIDAGSVSLRMEPVAIADVLDGMVEELGDRRDRISIAVAPSLPPLVTDGQRIGQVVRNMVENGLKFSPASSAVRVTAHHDGRRLMLEVADDGPGIPEEDIPHIFDRFHQVGGSMRRRSDGFGLGLYIARRLIEALGGTIEVHSVVGKGTTFRMRIPAVAADDARASETA